MRYLVSCSQMKALDANTIEQMGVPSLVLMERASLAVAEELARRTGRTDRILVLCGTGNNGGDGVAAARILHLWGYAVSLYQPGNPSKYSRQTGIQREIADKYGVPVVNNPDMDEYTVIVDALFGVGLAREVGGQYAGIIEAVNASGARVWAVDVPSGINGDTGAVMGHAVRADYTVTFAFGKTGLYLYPGAAFCGEVIVRDIGIYMEPEIARESVRALGEDDLSMLPVRAADGNKGTFGKVLVAAGSKNMAGAAYLCASGALRSGAGMVKIRTVEENRCILQTLLPEALLSTDADGVDEEALRRDLDWADVLVLGPGIGTDGRAAELVRCCLENWRGPTVLDADALNILAARPELPRCGGRAVMTPHMGELARLLGVSVDEVKRDPFGSAFRLASGRDAVCVAKDARTVTMLPEGTCWLNLSGNDGMATAGSGDVLSGILGGLLAQKMAPEDAAPLGVYLHGLAGDAAARRVGRRSMTARDILAGIDEVLQAAQTHER